MTDSLAASFDPVSLDEWREKVGEPAASGVPTTEIEDGIEVPWLFVGEPDAPADPAGTPGESPFVRGTAPGTAWDVRQEQRLADRALARAAVLADLEGGATSAVIRLDRAAADGLSPDGDDFTDAVGDGGIAAYTVDDLDELLDGVHLDLAPVAIGAHAGAVEAAAMLIALWQRRGHDPATIGGALGIDPLGALAATGRLDSEPADELARAGAIAAEADALLGPAVTVLGVDTTAHVAAGASAAEELAVAIATGTAYLRAAEAAGLTPDRTVARLEFTLQGDADQFVGIAKLRAARRMWARVLEASGVPAEQRRSRMVSRTSDRMLAAVDPWVNILRATTAAFAAAVGGADAITVAPFDAPRAASTELGRRIARNTQHVLMDEAHLARVGDPGGGAWYVEWLTDRLARAAWARLQEIEAGGGLLAELEAGRIAQAIADTAATRASEIAHRERVLTGVNAFPLLGPDGMPEADPIDLPTLAARERDRLLERERERPAATTPTTPDPDARPTLAELVDRAAAGERIDQLRAGRTTHTAPPLTPTRDSADFETLRTRAEQITPPPAILVACAGPIARHNAVATWARSFFGAGGIAAEQTGPLLSQEDATQAAEQAGPTPLAVVCADPEEDAELLQQITSAVRDAGARRVYLAQADAETARDAGADEGVRDGVDMVAVLTNALDLCESES